MGNDKKPSAYRNAEGYYDPTAGEAYSNITADERKRDAERLAAISSLMPILRMVTELALRLSGVSHSQIRRQAKSISRRTNHMIEKSRTREVIVDELRPCDNDNGWKQP